MIKNFFTLQQAVVLGIMIGTCTLMISGCKADSARPEGWTEESHGSSAEPDYVMVFPQGEVKRIDIQISSADWLLMQLDIGIMLGIRGGGTPASAPPQWFDVCDGRQLRDNCTCYIGPVADPLEGTCMNNMDKVNPQLMCLPFRADYPPQARNQLVPGTPIFRPCAVSFEGRTWQHVGLRFRGNANLKYPWQAGIMKLPFKLHFDHFEDWYPEIEDQRFYGFKELALINNLGDPSRLREKVAYDIYRDAGIPAPHAAFYRVYIDFGQGPVYFGLYTMAETPGSPMFETMFGDKGGNLYKPENYGARWVNFSDYSFLKKNNEKEADYSDIQAAIAALHADRRDPALWRAGLESTFNVDGFLRWLAVNTVIQNWDTYGNLAHNYYLYNNPADGRLNWIPWDNTMAFVPEGGLLLPLTLGFAEVGDDWPLIRYLYDDPVYHATYVSLVRETIQGVYGSERAQARFQAEHDLIEPYVTGDQGEMAPYAAPGMTPESFDAALQTLLAHPDARVEAVQEFLDNETSGLPGVVINEIHYHPSSAQGDGEYEFIELYNPGKSSVDISGWSFTEGIKYIFPQGTLISPAEYIVVAKDAVQYSGLSCRVFQWDAGSLANEGEAVQLKTAEGVEIDFVRYADAWPWPEEADGAGASLELTDALNVNSLAENWKASLTTGGTPGAANSAATQSARNKE